MIIDSIRERLTEIRPPGAQRDVVALGLVRGIDLHDGTVLIRFAPGALPPPIANAVAADMRRAVGALEGVSAVEIQMQRDGGGAAAEQAPLPGVRDIIAVTSAKGGVGKSTVATNLALALHVMGKRVGLMDADVYGPSLPIMLGITGRPLVSEAKRVFPMEKYGLQLMSMGFFLDDSSPVIWRGPLVMGLVRQFLRDVEWRDLDLLVIDLPPGTGDAPLTLVQQVPLAGGIVVTTPQDVALLDVQRGIAMFEQVNTPILGVVENMSYYHCPKCGRDEEIFGSGGGQRISERFGVPLLGRLPLVQAVREGGDAGTPIVVAHPEHPVSRSFVDIAARVLEEIEVNRQAAPVIIG
jgi:ATP-binding protein involved in chromosome partitioning